MLTVINHPTQSIFKDKQGNRYVFDTILQAKAFAEYYYHSPVAAMYAYEVEQLNKNIRKEA